MHLLGHRTHSAGVPQSRNVSGPTHWWHDLGDAQRETSIRTGRALLWPILFSSLWPSQPIDGSLVMGLPEYQIRATEWTPCLPLFYFSQALKASEKGLLFCFVFPPPLLTWYLISITWWWKTTFSDSSIPALALISLFSAFFSFHEIT